MAVRLSHYLSTSLLSLGLLIFVGCGKQNPLPPVTSQHKQDSLSTIYSAFNDKNYEYALTLIGQFFEKYPDDLQVPALRLLLADIKFEQSEYHDAYEAYRLFVERYPADERTDYARYKAAHAKFAQANHVSCDATSTQETLNLCREYKNNSECTKYTSQMEALERTCQQRLIDKEFYVANTYLNNHKLASAQHRLESIRKDFDLAEFNSLDKALFYEAKLAKLQDRSDECLAIIENLHLQYPESPFTQMADRLTNRTWF